MAAGEAEGRAGRPVVGRRAAPIRADVLLRAVADALHGPLGAVRAVRPVPHPCTVAAGDHLQRSV